MHLYPHFTVRTLPSSKLLQRKPSEDNSSTVGPSLRLLLSYGHLSITETSFGSRKKKLCVTLPLFRPCCSEMVRCNFHIYIYVYIDIVWMKIHDKSYIRTADETWVKFVILAVCYQLKQLKKQPKNDTNPWPCDTGAILYPLSYQATWIHSQLSVRINLMIVKYMKRNVRKIIYVNGESIVSVFAW